MALPAIAAILIGGTSAIARMLAGIATQAAKMSGSAILRNVVPKLLRSGNSLGAIRKGAKKWVDIAFKKAGLIRPRTTGLDLSRRGFFEIPGGYESVPQGPFSGENSLKFTVDTSQMYAAVENLRISTAEFNKWITPVLHTLGTRGVTWIRRNYLSGGVRGLKQQTGKLYRSLRYTIIGGRLIFATRGVEYAKAHRGMTITGKGGFLAIPRTPAIGEKYGESLQGDGLTTIYGKFLTPSKKLKIGLTRALGEASPYEDQLFSPITHTLEQSVRLPKRFAIEEAAYLYLVGAKAAKQVQRGLMKGIRNKLKSRR